MEGFYTLIVALQVFLILPAATQCDVTPCRHMELSWPEYLVSLGKSRAAVEGFEIYSFGLRVEAQWIRGRSKLTCRSYCCRSRSLAGLG